MERLPNIYLHYVMDLWVRQWRKRTAKGEMIAVRYADDSVLGFEKHEDAWSFRHAMKVRLAQFNLTLHPEKTRLLRFGWFAVEDRKKRGLSLLQASDQPNALLIALAEEQQR